MWQSNNATGASRAYGSAVMFTFAPEMGDISADLALAEPLSTTAMLLSRSGVSRRKVDVLVGEALIGEEVFQMMSNA